MDSFVKDMYIALYTNPIKPKEIAKMAVLVQEIVSTEKGYEFIEQYCRRGGTYLYGEYMKERTKRIFSKTTVSTGITI